MQRCGQPCWAACAAGACWAPRHPSPRRPPRPQAEWLPRLKQIVTQVRWAAAPPPGLPLAPGRSSPSQSGRNTRSVPDTPADPRPTPALRQVSATFSDNFQCVGCAGEVVLHEAPEEDFEHYAIEIRCGRGVDVRIGVPWVCGWGVGAERTVVGKGSSKAAHICLRAHLPRLPACLRPHTLAHSCRPAPGSSSATPRRCRRWTPTGRAAASAACRPSSTSSRFRCGLSGRGWLWDCLAGEPCSWSWLQRRAARCAAALPPATLHTCTSTLPPMPPLPCPLFLLYRFLQGGDGDTLPRRGRDQPGHGPRQREESLHAARGRRVQVRRRSVERRRLVKGCSVGAAVAVQWSIGCHCSACQLAAAASYLAIRPAAMAFTGRSLAPAPTAIAQGRHAAVLPAHAQAAAGSAIHRRRDGAADHERRRHQAGKWGWGGSWAGVAGRDGRAGWRGVRVRPCHATATPAAWSLYCTGYTPSKPCPWPPRGAGGGGVHHGEAGGGAAHAAAGARGRLSSPAAARARSAACSLALHSHASAPLLQESDECRAAGRRARRAGARQAGSCLQPPLPARPCSASHCITHQMFSHARHDNQNKNRYRGE